MKIATTRFGDVDVPESEVYSFPEGILGFSDIRQYVVLNNPKGGPFQWLQSLELPSLAFVVCDPRIFMSDYKIKVKEEDISSIKLYDIAGGFVLVIVTVPKDPMEMTANLLGPLIFNPKEKLAKQLVLSESGYTTKHKILKGDEQGSVKD
ncbi:MAG: hypothetical protein A2W23_08320 [Planctomycetes bacterium RBG_16_43_13]|nr:MAG: hypothetical protein A2W23_08320 [Planctomycetes bacterium RBG_16_43_13]